MRDPEKDKSAPRTQACCQTTIDQLGKQSTFHRYCWKHVSPGSRMRTYNKSMPWIPLHRSTHCRHWVAVIMPELEVEFAGRVRTLTSAMWVLIAALPYVLFANQPNAGSLVENYACVAAAGRLRGAKLNFHWYYCDVFADQHHRHSHRFLRLCAYLWARSAADMEEELWIARGYLLRKSMSGHRTEPSFGRNFTVWDANGKLPYAISKRFVLICTCKGYVESKS